MASARGDRQPCTHTACSGTMQFGREPLHQTSSSTNGEGERGWVCSVNPGHFQRGAERPRPGAGAKSAAHARWSDDGGAMLPEPNAETRL
jgi:hypothetical protein